MLSLEKKRIGWAVAPAPRRGGLRVGTIFSALMLLVFLVPLEASGAGTAMETPSRAMVTSQREGLEVDRAPRSEPEDPQAPEKKAGPARRSLAYFIGLARERNPRLRAAFRRWKMSEERPAQARALENPVLRYTEPAREIETRLGPVDRAFSLSQKLPFPGKLGLKGDIASKEAEIARLEYEKLLRDLTAEVKKTYYELYFVDKAIELQKENEAVLEYFAEISRRNYGLDVSELDELVRAQKSSAGATFALLKARDMRKTVTARLNTLLDRPPDTEVGPIEEPDFLDVDLTVEKMFDLARKYNENIRLAGLGVEKSELERKLARFSYLPDFSVGVNYSQIGQPPSMTRNAGDDALSFTLGVSIPIWFRKNRASLDEKKEGALASRFEKRAELQEISGLVKEVYYNMSTSRRIALLYKKRFIPEAKDSMDFAEARYKTGKESLGRLLETQSMWIDFRLIYYRSFADYLKDIAELERLTATEFTK